MNIRSLNNLPGLLKHMGIVIFAFCWARQALPQNVEFDWVKHSGGTSNDGGYGIAVDDAGHVYVTGYFNDNATFGSTTLTTTGSCDIFIAKLHASGYFLWTRQAGGWNNEEGLGIAVDGYGNVWVTGFFESTTTFESTTLTTTGYRDIFIARLESTKNFLWTKQAGGSGNDEGSGITVDDYGNAYVTGYFKDTATFGSITLNSVGEEDIFITKIDASGYFLWAKQVGGSGTDFGEDIVVDDSGNVYVTGFFKGTFTFGSTTLTSAGMYDIFIVKLNDSGNFLWAKQVGGNGVDVGEEIAVDDSGNVYVTGGFSYTATFGSTMLTSTSMDIFIVKLDDSGNFLWVKQAGGTSNDRGEGIAIDGSGNVYVTGYFQNVATFGSTELTSAGEYDLFIVKLNDSGDFLWAKRAGGSGRESGEGISVDGSGNVYVTGYFYGITTLGSTVLTSEGGDDIFVAKTTDLTSVESERTGIVTEFKLFQNYPNPFNPETLIKYQIPEPSQVTIKIFDLQGREITTLVSAQKEAGYHSTVWDGRDQQGRNVSNGIYLCRFKAGSYIQPIRMIFLK